MATDSFPTNGPTLGASWGTQTGQVSLSVATNAAQANDIFNACGNYRTAEVYTAAQSSQAVAQSGTPQRECSVRVRCQAGANTYYAGGYDNFTLASQGYQIWKVIAGAPTSLITPLARVMAATEIVKLTIDAAFGLTLSVNGSPILTFDDALNASITGGVPGIGGYAGAAALVWDDFVSTGDGAAAAVVNAGRMSLLGVGR